MSTLNIVGIIFSLKFYASPNIIMVDFTRRMGWVGHRVRMGKVRNVYKTSVCKTGGKRSIGRSSYRWENNIGIDLTEIRREVVNQDRIRWTALVNIVVNILGP
jgi:hypothetical protein